MSEDLKKIIRKKEAGKPNDNDTFRGHICYAAADNCRNPDSYGCICVRCNQCGRFTKEKTNG